MYQNLVEKIISLQKVLGNCNKYSARSMVQIGGHDEISNKNIGASIVAYRSQPLFLVDTNLSAGVVN